MLQQCQILPTQQICALLNIGGGPSPIHLFLKKHKVLIILGDGVDKLPRTTIAIMLCLNNGFPLPNQVSFTKFCSLNQRFFKEINILPII
jgi:hypothetical protein